MKKITEQDKSFFAGTMAALDCVYMHTDASSTLPVEIVRAVGAQDLLAYASSEECGYHNLSDLRVTVEWALR